MFLGRARLGVCVPPQEWDGRGKGQEGCNASVSHWTLTGKGKMPQLGHSLLFARLLPSGLTLDRQTDRQTAKNILFKNIKLALLLLTAYTPNYLPLQKSAGSGTCTAVSALKAQFFFDPSFFRTIKTLVLCPLPPSYQR